MGAGARVIVRQGGTALLLYGTVVGHGDGTVDLAALRVPHVWTVDTAYVESVSTFQVTPHGGPSPEPPPYAAAAVAVSS